MVLLVLFKFLFLFLFDLAIVLVDFIPFRWKAILECLFRSRMLLLVGTGFRTLFDCYFRRLRYRLFICFTFLLLHSQEQVRHKGKDEI